MIGGGRSPPITLLTPLSMASTSGAYAHSPTKILPASTQHGNITIPFLYKLLSRCACASYFASYPSWDGQPKPNELGTSAYWVS